MTQHDDNRYPVDSTLHSCCQGIGRHTQTCSCKAETTDLHTDAEIRVTTRAFRDAEENGTLAGRAYVKVESDAGDELALSVEDAIRVALGILNAAANAMHHDPRPWRIDRPHMAAFEAAHETLKRCIAEELR